MTEDLATHADEAQSVGAGMPSREDVKRMCLEHCDEMTDKAYEHPQSLSRFDWGLILVTGIGWIVLTYTGIFMG